MVKQTGHRGFERVRRYIRDGSLFVEQRGKARLFGRDTLLGLPAFSGTPSTMAFA
jgi:hypothetical protein